MRPDRVVVTPPTLDDNPGLAQCVEDFAIEQFIAQADLAHADRADGVRNVLALQNQDVDLPQLRDDLSG